MLSVCAIVLMCIGFIFARPILILFGASENALVYAYPYIMIYLIGTFPSMIATGRIHSLMHRDMQRQE